MLFTLPCKVQSLILNDLLDGAPAELSALDIACAPSIRESFLRFLAEDGQIRVDLFSMNYHRFGQWLTVRSARLTTLRLPIHQCHRLLQLDQLFFFNILELQLFNRSTSKRTTLATDEDIEAALEYLISSCVNLQSINVSIDVPRHIIQYVLTILLDHPALSLQHFHCLSSLPDSVALWEALLVTFSSTLTSLSLLEIDCSTLLTTIAVCTKLVRLSVQLSTEDVSLTAVCEFLNSLPSLEELRFDTCYSSSFLRHLFCGANVKRMNRLHIGSLIGRRLAHSKFLMSIFNACPDLCALYVHPIALSATNCSSIKASAATVLEMVGEDKTDSVLMDIMPALPLGELREFRAAGLTGEGLVMLAQHCEATLRVVSLSINRHMSFVSIHYLFSNLVNVVHLELIDKTTASITDAVLDLLASSEIRLQSLSLQNSISLTNKGMDVFLTTKGMDLTKLSLEGCRKLNQQALCIIVSCCTALQELNLSGTLATTMDIFHNLVKANELYHLRALWVGLRQYKPLLEHIAKSSKIQNRWISIIRKRL
eukprot:scaffold12509_cov198-Ochromonas_danica.AAC.6